MLKTNFSLCKYTPKLLYNKIIFQKTSMKSIAIFNFAFCN